MTDKPELHSDSEVFDIMIDGIVKIINSSIEAGLCTDCIYNGLIHLAIQNQFDIPEGEATIVRLNVEQAPKKKEYIN